MSKAALQRKKTFFSVLFVSCIDNFGFGLVFILFAPLMLKPEYGMLSPDTGLDTRNTLLGILFLAFPLMTFFGAPLLGDIADRFGRKKAFYATIIGGTLGYLVSAIGISMHSYLILLVSRLWSGFFSGNLSICLAAIADLSTDEKSRARNFGWMTVVWGFSWPLAILVGGYLSDPSVSSYFGPTIPFYVTILLSLATLLAIAKMFKETHPVEKGVRIDIMKGISNVITATKIKAIRPFFLILLFWTIGWGMSVQWYGAFTMEKFRVSQQVISWGLVLLGILWVFGGSFVNPMLLRKFSTIKTAIIGLFIAALFVLLCSVGSTFWMFSWIYFIGAIGSAFAFSNTMNLCSMAAPKAIQGKAMGLSQSMMSLGWMVVPVFASSVGNFDISVFYPSAALFIFLALVTLVLKGKLKDKMVKKTGA
ncbi:MAG: MFS transporter [Verrucomicrobia bacterium]|nr:MFS transporter [Verrucomicrobiota bacterium]